MFSRYSVCLKSKDYIKAYYKGQYLLSNQSLYNHYIEFRLNTSINSFSCTIQFQEIVGLFKFLIISKDIRSSQVHVYVYRRTC